MADKQIIIDGVDVSGCKKLMQGIVPFGCMEDRKTCSCMNNPNCLYKQLKRKEQECEELKEEIDDLKEIIQRHDNDNNALLSEFEDDLVDYYRRYKECLTEIKEIVEENLRIADLEGLNGVYRRGLATQILQKISEIDNE